MFGGKEIKMKLYLIRHGQRGFFYDYDTLLPEGIWQSIKVGKYLKNIKLNVIYCSPQKRAKETLKYLNLKKKAIITSRLRQQAVPGEVDKAIQLLKKRDTPEQLSKRVKAFLLYIMKNHHNEIVLCVTHKLFIKELVKQLINSDKNIASGSITCFEFKGKKLIKNYIGKVVYPKNNPNLIKNYFFKASKNLTKKQLEQSKKKALEVAKKGKDKKDIANAYLSK